MPRRVAQSRCYAVRLLNPYQGVAQIVETDAARAIYKSPWSSLAVPETDKRFFVYGIWSQQQGLSRTPIHPGLYQDHVEDTVQTLLGSIRRDCCNLPFPLRDTIELWLIEPADRQPVALLACSLPHETLPKPGSLLWHPSPNTDMPFVSKAYCENLDRAIIKGPTQDLLLDLVEQRCKPPYQALWIERDAQGGGTVLHNHIGKNSRRSEHIAANKFPVCLLTEDWPSIQTRRLVKDYLNWQAPMLLMLPLPAARRRELECQAQHRPLSVHSYYRLYPEVMDKTLLNRILVEAVMRMSSQ